MFNSQYYISRQSRCYTGVSLPPTHVYVLDPGYYIYIQFVLCTIPTQTYCVPMGGDCKYCVVHYKHRILVTRLFLLSLSMIRLKELNIRLITPTHTS